MDHHRQSLLRVPVHGAARVAATASGAATDSADSVTGTGGAPYRSGAAARGRPRLARAQACAVNPPNGRQDMTTTETNPIDQARLEAFVGQAVTDMGAAISGLMLHIGDRLRLHKASGRGG